MKKIFYFLHQRFIKSLTIMLLAKKMQKKFFRQLYIIITKDLEIIKLKKLSSKKVMFFFQVLQVAEKLFQLKHLPKYSMFLSQLQMLQLLQKQVMLVRMLRILFKSFYKNVIMTLKGLSQALFILMKQIRLHVKQIILQ